MLIDGNSLTYRAFFALPVTAGRHPQMYLEALAQLPPRQIVVVAVPDPLHHEVILAALRANQHVLAVKPLVLTVAHAREIEIEAMGRGLMVGIEYHKRLDDRSLLARRRYRDRHPCPGHRWLSLPPSRLRFLLLPSTRHLNG